LNKVTLIGNLGNDPEVRSTTGGNRVATFSLATSRSWNNQAGDKLYVEGRIEYRQWQDKDGQTRYSTEINVRELIMLGGRSGGSSGDFESDGASAGGSRSRAAATGGRAKSASPGTGGSGEDFEDFPGALEDEDDDLPF
jgi:single-strand DNA-binding protein